MSEPIEREEGWWFVRRRGWGQEYGPWAPALWRPDVQTWNSATFRNLEDRNVLVGEHINLPALPVAADALTEHDMALLRHMLGVESGRGGYRNHFSASKEQMDNMQRLLKAGLVLRGKQDGALVSFHATTKGCQAAGLTVGQNKQACAFLHCNLHCQKSVKHCRAGAAVNVQY